MMQNQQSTSSPPQRSLVGRCWRRMRSLLPRPLKRRFAPVPPGLALVNLWHQRLFDRNGQVPWMVHFTSRVTGDITIGRKVWVSFAVSGGCYVQGKNGIEIGDDTLFAPNVSIVSANHVKGDLTSWENGPPVKIGQRCWIGAGAIILPGVQLGDDVIVGAGAVVTKSFPSGAVLGGVPARMLNHEEPS